MSGFLSSCAYVTEGCSRCAVEQIPKQAGRSKIRRFLGHDPTQSNVAPHGGGFVPHRSWNKIACREHTYSYRTSRCK